MEFYRPTITDLSEAIQDYGTTISPRGKATRELIGANMSWPLGTYPVREKMPRRLAAVEGTSLIAGQFNPDLIRLAAPAVDMQLFEQSAKYALSIARQVPKAVHILKKEPSSRRAILYFGRPQDVGGDRTTCLSTLHWLVRDGKLFAILNQRSSDLAWGLPIDVVAVTALSLAVAQFLQVLPGHLILQIGSLHMYESSMHRAVSAANPIGQVIVTLADPQSYRGWTRIRDEAREHMNETAWKWVIVV